MRCDSILIVKKTDGKRDRSWRCNKDAGHGGRHENFKGHRYWTDLNPIEGEFRATEMVAPGDTGRSVEPVVPGGGGAA